MYDRKTWVVLALCGAILAANVYYSGITTREKEAAAAIEKARIAKETPAPLPEGVNPIESGLTVETPPPSTEEVTVTLESDEVIYTLTSTGGGIKYAELKNQYQVGSKTALVRMNHFGTGPIGALAGTDESPENANYTYKEEQSVKGKKAVFVSRLGTSGLTVKKTFSLVEAGKPGSPYLLDFQMTVENLGTNDIPLGQWSLFMGEASPLYQAEVAQQTGFFWRTKRGIDFKDGHGFQGGMFSSEKSVLRSATTDPIEYAGVTSQFFATVLRPKEPYVSEVWSKPAQVSLVSGAKSVTSVRAGLDLPAVSLKPKEQKTIDYLIFMGPKHNPMLRDMNAAWGTGWGDVMQYGWFGVVSNTLNHVLNTYHGWIDGVAKNWSWGLAIILLTISVRLVMWPLQAKSTHTMKRMAKLQPEMQKIREKYADDPNKVNTETMGLYRKYGINPLGGCLPMFIQIPVFFGFYRMLQYAVELRGHGFLWVGDLSQPDTLLHIGFLGGIPLNILPMVMAVTSFVQIQMTPKTGDPTQQKIMAFMPFIFFFFCYNFASALALYWTTQNIFQIGQTWLTNRMPEPELKARPAKDTKPFMQRMMERQAEAQKAQKERQKNGPGGMRDVTPEKEKKRTPRTGG